MQATQLLVIQQKYDERYEPIAEFCAATGNLIYRFGIFMAHPKTTLGFRVFAP